MSGASCSRREELKKVRRRIETVSRLDLIGRAVATLVRMVRPTARADRWRAVGLPLARGLPLIGSTFAVARAPRAFSRIYTTISLSHCRNVVYLARVRRNPTAYPTSRLNGSARFRGEGPTTWRRVPDSSEMPGAPPPGPVFVPE